MFVQTIEWCELFTFYHHKVLPLAKTTNKQQSCCPPPPPEPTTLHLTTGSSIRGGYGCIKF